MIWHSSTASEVLDKFNSNKESGLTSTEAKNRLEKYKENEIHDYTKKSFLNILHSEASGKFNITLFALAIVYLLLSVATEYNAIAESIIILILTAFRVLVKTCAEFFTHKQINKYCISVKSTATVIRDSVEMIVPATQLVPGDIIIVKEGDYIPADARLIDSYVLKCDEFALTGEEIPVDKYHDSVYDDITPISKRFNMIYCGTNVINGQATAIVTGTGTFTEIGKAESINQIANNKDTPLKSTVSQVEKVITYSALGVSLLLFLVTLIVDFNSSNISFAITVMQKILLSLAFFSVATFGFLSSYQSIVTTFSAKHFEDCNVLPINVSVTEKLKDVSVICTDKSGVITSNKMSVVKVFNGNEIIDLNCDAINDGAVSILRLALICSNFEESEHFEKHANSMEKAIEDACIKYSSVNKSDIDGIYPKLCELPFAHDRRLMTIVTAINGKPYAIIKGAPEVIAARCLKVNEENLDKISNSFAEEGLKVISIAMKPLSEIPANPNSDELENGLTFVGTIGIDDPINKDIVSIIKDCKSLGKKIIMLTGDHISTAITVAKKVGILSKDSEAISCTELANLTDEELTDKIKSCTVFARVSSEDKLRIVKILKEQGENVLVTGDSINDSYALREADIGCSMGLTATDMVNYSADMIITDNKFSSLFSAICESYSTIEKIKRGIHFTVTCGIIESLLILLGSLIFKKVPFSIPSLLVFNTVFAPLLVLAFSLEKHNKEKLSKKLDNFLNVKSILTAIIPTIIISTFTLIGFGSALKSSYFSAISAAFLIMTIGLIIHSFTANTKNPLFSLNTLNFRIVPLAALILLVLTLLLTLSPIGTIVSFETITSIKVWTILLCGVSVLITDELLKFFIK